MPIIVHTACVQFSSLSSVPHMALSPQMTLCTLSVTRYCRSSKLPQPPPFLHAPSPPHLLCNALQASTRTLLVINAVLFMRRLRIVNRFRGLIPTLPIFRTYNYHQDIFSGGCFFTNKHYCCMKSYVYQKSANVLGSIWWNLDGVGPHIFGHCISVFPPLCCLVSVVCLKSHLSAASNRLSDHIQMLL